jgi:hypothetical protein
MPTTSLPVVGYHQLEVEFPDDKLKDKVEIDGRNITVARATVQVPNYDTGEQERIEVVAPTAWCYSQIKEAYLAKRARLRTELASSDDDGGATIEPEVIWDGDDGSGDVAGRSTGRPESSGSGDGQ